ncbi:MAG: NepR family anti-sigma factor [Erythrobacter sp.]
MTAEKKTAKNAKEQGTKDLQDANSTEKMAQEPDWANGLRQLYDSVVDEPLPDSFKDLLSQLDDKSQDG